MITKTEWHLKPSQRWLITSTMVTVGGSLAGTLHSSLAVSLIPGTNLILSGLKAESAEWSAHSL